MNELPYIEETILMTDKLRMEQRGWRFTAAINAVQLARSHAGRTENDPYSQSETNILMAITDLLDQVATV